MNENYINPTAVLYSKTGKSMFKDKTSTDNVNDFRPAQETIDNAVRELKNLGIGVRRVGGFGVSLKVTKENFERIFQTTLEEKVQGTSKYYEAKGEIKVPDTLKSYVEQIVLPVPPMLF